MNELGPDSRYNVVVKVVEYETLSRRKRIDGTIVEVGQAMVGDLYGCAFLILRGGKHQASKQHFSHKFYYRASR